MYEIIAIIRLNRLRQTKEALVAAGFPAFTAARASGRGEGSGLEQWSEAGNGPGNAAAGAPVLPRLFPKRLVLLVVPDRLVDQAVQVIIEANRTGTPGDGKIFVAPVIQARRLRSGESGPRAIDEMTG